MQLKTQPFRLQTMSRHNDKPIKDVLHEYISTNQKVSKGYHTLHIQEVWSEQMGPLIASYTSKITYSNGVLRVTLTSSPLKKELSMGKEKIIDIINTSLGQPLVKEVIIY